MKLFKLTFLAILLVGTVVAQDKKDITLEDIWEDYKFYPNSIYGLRSMNDGLFYTSTEKGELGNEIVKRSYAKRGRGELIVAESDLKFNDKQVKISDYEFSADESKLLIASEKEAIYRHSSKSHYYVYDLKSKELNKLSEGKKQMYATFSPSANKIAFVRDNNLFCKDLSSNNETQITTDGKKNAVLNGISDWVYEEELVLVKAFNWSPDGKKIAFYKFNESEVKEWMLKMYGELYPKEVRFKYPKAGEDNSKVEIFIYHVETKKTVKVNVSETYEYIPRIDWSNDSKQLMLQITNRHQNHLQMLLADNETGETKLVLSEKDESYIEVPVVHFLKSKNQFLLSSEKDGFNHLYLYDINGQLINQITKGSWDVTSFYGVDEKRGLVFYQSSKETPLEKHVYSVKLNGTSQKKLTAKSGVNRASFSKSFTYFINYHTDANTAEFITLNDFNGKQKRVLEDNEVLNNRISSFNVSPKEFLTIDVNGETLNAWMIKPLDFDKTKKYPVFMYQYSGPGSQQVTNGWGGSNYFWFQHLASKGYITVCVDGRGTGARGAAFKKVTYKQLGKYETEDQIASAKYLSTLPYVDGSRIGIFGWSYGGYMSSLCLFKGNDVFKTAIAVAPVTNWRYYDNIYTERYMQTPQENAKGYDDNSPINHVEKLKGNYLLIHGMGDDNVHFQNATEMIMELVKQNKQFTQFGYPNKNHGIYGGNTRLHLYNLMTNYILENL